MIRQDDDRYEALLDQARGCGWQVTLMSEADLPGRSLRFRTTGTPGRAAIFEDGGDTRVVAGTLDVDIVEAVEAEAN